MKNFLCLTVVCLLAAGAGRAQDSLLTAPALLETPTYIRLTDALRHAETARKLRLTDGVELSDEVMRLKVLQELTLESADEPIGALPDGLFACTTLTRLACYGTALKKLPTALGKLTHLRVLVVRDTTVKALPLEVTTLKELEVLDAPHAKLPPDIRKLRRLRVLHTDAAFLPVMHGLEELHYYGSKLPDSIPHFRALQRVYFYHPETRLHKALDVLKQMPTVVEVGFAEGMADRYGWERLSRMAPLEGLRLTATRYLPPDVLDLKNLRRVRLDNSRCLTAKSCVELFGVLAKLPRLDTLILDGYAPRMSDVKQLKVVRLEHCPDLKEADLDATLLAALEPLTALTGLSLMHTDLSKARNPHFGRLKKLESLNLAFTRLPYDVATFDELRPLKSLTIAHTDLDVGKCAEEMGQLRELRLLVIYNLPDAEVPPLSDACKKWLREALPGCKIIFYE